MANAIEYLFGPPSEPINIATFTQSALVEVESSHFGESDGEERQVPGERIAAECRVSDIRKSLFDVWNNPRLSAHISKDHEHTVTFLYATTKSAKPKRKAHLPDPETLPPEITTLQKNFDGVKLRSWKLQTDSVPFMRTPKNTDHNVLARVKSSPSASQLSGFGHAIITITVYNRVAWGLSYVSRASQHALLSSQTLGELFRIIPCTSKELPDEVVVNDQVSGYSRQHGEASSEGCVICIEGTAYGDGLAETDYADKLLLHLEKISKNPSAIKKASTTLHDTPFSSLSLRINEPYWLLHQGNCEHYIVIDQIRLQHPSDPTSGYPLTLQITPPLLDMCRACTRVPAALSIVGDVRLGENPCLMCNLCWRNIGDPLDQQVIVAPLPTYGQGVSKS